MNKIAFKKHQSQYPIYGQYLELFIDDKPLDEFLYDIYPNQNIKGLVSPFDNWLMNKADQDLVMRRYLPEVGQSNILPILICPDDQDFSCTVIVTKVVADGLLIKWENFGLNKFSLNEDDIEWFEQSHALIFNRDRYEEEFENLLNQNL